MRARISLREALADPQLLGHALAGDSFALWRTILIATMGEPLSEGERARFREFTDRDPPDEPVREAAFIVGRRGGKDRTASALVAYLATCCEWPMLAKGETGRVIAIAPDQSQARIQFGYVLGVLEGSPTLSKTIIHATTDTIELENRIVIEVRAANYRRLRGVTCVGVIASESAFWYDDASSNPDSEILRAVRPSLLTTGGVLLQISTPHAKRGELYQSFKRHYGKDSRVLVVKGASLDFNSTLDRAEIERAYADDPAFAAAEYGGEFRDDIAAFVSREVLDACVDVGVAERQPAAAFRYRAFVDPSGGSADSFALAIGHWESDAVVIDCLREITAPFSPESAVEELCLDLARYRVTSVSGDRYAGLWPTDQFQKRGISYEPSKLDASALFRELLPRLNTRSIFLLDHKRSLGQLANLERRTGRAGRDTIDHPRGSHNDIANVIAGVSQLLESEHTATGAIRVGYYPIGGGAITWTDPRQGRVSALSAADGQNECIPTRNRNLG